ncbi:MAG: substrate-binding domain-containing protein [Planctomycetota bacterium]|nr:substrate-binding domain-containing protein [Planctomycetota bacterium]
MAIAALIAGCPKSKEEVKQPKIAGIVFQDDQFFRLIQFGMNDAAKKVGIDLLVANSMNMPGKEIQLVNTYIARQVDAIVISPISTKASAVALKRASDKGIKIITYNSTVEGDITSVYIESDQGDLGAQSGKVAKKYIEDKLNGKAKVAIIAFKSQVPEQSDARTNGFKKEITSLPGVEIVAEQDAWLAEMAIKKVGDIITANQNVDIIWAANEGGTVGAVMAVKNAGKGRKIAVFGTDTSEQLISFLLSEDNILQAITGQRPFEIGSLAIESALKVLKGQTVDRKISMAGVLLSRDDTQGVISFQKRLKELMAGDNK